MDISRLAAARGSEHRLALWGTCLQVRKWLGSLLSQNELSSDRWLLLSGWHGYRSNRSVDFTSIPRVRAISCAMGQPTRGLRRLNSTNRVDEFLRWPFWAGAPMVSRREKPPIFALLERIVEPELVLGFRMTATLGIRLAGTNSDPRPKTKRSKNSGSAPFVVRGC